MKMKMLRWIKFYLPEVLIVAAICAVLIGVPLLDRAACASKWEGSGMKSKWGVLSGCMVQRKDGTWIPEKNMRDVSQ